MNSGGLLLLAFDSSDLPGLIAFLLITVLSGLGGLLKKNKNGPAPGMPGDETAPAADERQVVSVPPMAAPQPQVVPDTMARRAAAVPRQQRAEPGKGDRRRRPGAGRTAPASGPVGDTGRPTRRMAEETVTPRRRARLTPSDLRRAIILREILAPPVAVRDPLEDLS